MHLGAASPGQLLFAPTTKLMEQGGSPQQTEHLNPKAWPAPEPTSGLQIAEHPTVRAQWVTQVPNRSRREGQRERHPRRQIAVEMVGSSRGPRPGAAQPGARHVLLTKVPLAVVALARVPLALVLLAVVLLAAVALALVPGSRSQSLRKHPQRKDRPPASNRPGRSPRLSRPGAG